MHGCSDRLCQGGQIDRGQAVRVVVAVVVDGIAFISTPLANICPRPATDRVSVGRQWQIQGEARGWAAAPSL